MFFKDASPKRTDQPSHAPSQGKLRGGLKRALGYAAGLLPGVGMVFYRQKLKTEAEVEYLERMREMDTRAVNRIANSKSLDELYRLTCLDIARDLGFDNVRILRVESNGELKLVGKTWISGESERDASELTHTIAHGDGHITSICYFEKKIIHMKINEGDVVVYGITTENSELKRILLELPDEVRAKILANAREQRIGEKIAVPLRDRGIVIGVIAADNRTSQLRVDDKVISSLHYRALIAFPVIKSFEESRIDALTGVPNKRYYDEISTKLFARAKRKGEPLSLIVFDLDKFKGINDAHGHAIGDIALKHFAALVTAKIRESDEFVRYGGEEFVLMLPGTNLHEAVKVADELRKGIEQTPADLGSNLFLKFTVSAGVAELCAEDSCVADLFARADAALKQAKEKGRNRVEAIKAG
ncbi:MAG: GGDEF domain-containing protein [Candidatus Micrarchaeia archaeon]